ncbi:hypothetical protein [Cerasicoccus arenae]|uniref:hypothetical protein n=1 Tax=Cerasicoccus arenae TaxID=424488 RepID=UPI0016774522|nr:hypothetical protein [Cerasicoccus arenae]MBK1858475.1 hypothetical protein [Cerasicoccus arenae]
MDIIFRINRNYNNIAAPLAAKTKRNVRPGRRRLGHALGNFAGGNTLTFYFNLIFR